MARTSECPPLKQTPVPRQRASRFNRIELLMSNCSIRYDDHDLGGLDEGCGNLSFFQTQLACCIGSDDRGNVLPADGESYLCEQTADSDVCNTPDELIASADAAKRAAPFLKRA